MTPGRHCGSSASWTTAARTTVAHSTRSACRTNGADLGAAPVHDPASAPGSALGGPPGAPGPHRQVNAAHTSRGPVRAKPSCLSAHCPAPGPSLAPEASTLAAARGSPGACGTQPVPPQAGAAREATEAVARPASNSGHDDRRSWGRSAHTCRCSRPRLGRRRCGPAGGAGRPRCRGRAGRRAGVSQPGQARCGATGHGSHGDAVRRQWPVRCPSYRQRRLNCSLNSPPGSRSCHYRGLEQRCCYHQTVHAGRAERHIQAGA